MRTGEISALQTTSEMSVLRNTEEILTASIDTTSPYEDPSDLHTIIAAMKSFHSSKMSIAIYEHSEKQLQVRTELGDLSRLRFITRAFHTRTSCQAYSLPCQHCGASELVCSFSSDELIIVRTTLGGKQLATSQNVPGICMNWSRLDPNV